MTKQVDKMSKKFFGIVTFTAFLITALGTSALIWLPRELHKENGRLLQRQTMVIVPHTFSESNFIGDKERGSAKIVLDDGEILSFV